MGSFSGHLYPGIVLLLYGILWIVLSQWLRLTGGIQKNESKRFCEAEKYKLFMKEKSYIPFPLCPRIPLESLGKIVIPLLAIMVELLFKNLAVSSEGKNHIVFKPWNIYKDDGSFDILDKLDHISMYLGFILSGILDLLLICLKDSKIKAQIFLSLAFGFEGFLFYLHAAHRESLDATLHKLLAFVALVSSLLSFLRAFYPSSFMINLSLGISVTLQGTWMIQIGNVLYGKKYWERENHENEEFIVNSFIWHVILLVFSSFLIHFILSIACQRHKAFGKTIEKESMELQNLIDHTDLESHENDNSAVV